MSDDMFEGEVEEVVMVSRVLTPQERKQLTELMLFTRWERWLYRLRSWWRRLWRRG